MSVQPVKLHKAQSTRDIFLAFAFSRMSPVHITETHYISSANNLSDIIILFNIFTRVWTYFAILHLLTLT